MRIVLIVCLLSFFAQAHGQESAPLPEAVTDRKAKLEELAASVSKPDTDLLALRDELRDLRRAAEAQTAPIRDRLAIARADLDRIGPPPGDGEPEEAPSIASERARLNSEIATLDGAVRQSDLNMAEADRLVAEVARLRREQFSTAVLSRGPSAASASLWTQALVMARDDLNAAMQAFTTWRSERSEAQELIPAIVAIVAAVLAALALFIPVRIGADRFIRNRITSLEPKASRKIMVAAARAAVRVVPGIIGGLIVYEVLRQYGAIPPSGAALARWIWVFFIAILLVDGCVVGVFAPESPKWRVVSLESWQVLSIRTLAFLATIILGAATVLLEGAKIFGNSQELTLAIQAAEAIVLSVTLFMLSRARLWTAKDPTADIVPQVQRDETDEEETTHAWPRLRLFGRVVAIVSVLAVLTGYIALGHYLTTKLFYLVALGAFIWLVRSLLRESMRFFDRNFTSHEKSEDSEKVLYFWIGFLIDAVAFMVFIPPALLVLGAEWADVRNWMSDAFFGFQVGSFRISIAKIASAVGLFFLLLYFTRVVQRTTEQRLFPKSRIDVGVQNSLKTLIGYVGLVIAFTVGVGVLGFDLSNLAIIAGALSVGIGFGLQSIVNNFVSGLILLFERPIKVGDWIVTQSGEGTVKRISVRSTEIETFDRSSVIVPNSELISSAVTNWTHKDKMGRVIIPIGVSYDSDPDQVIALLKEVAKDHPSILNYPAPFIYFGAFADSSLNFELRGFIRDVSTGLGVRSELRIAIYKKFKEAGIEIPFPQRDITIKAASEQVTPLAEPQETPT